MSDQIGQMIERRIVVDAPTQEAFDESKVTLASLPGVVEVVRGKVVGCPKCDMLMVEGGTCEGCALAAVHQPGCRLLRAATCAIAISCEAHGRDVCPICDVCDCTVLP